MLMILCILSNCPQHYRAGHSHLFVQLAACIKQSWYSTLLCTSLEISGISILQRILVFSIQIQRCLLTLGMEF